MKQIKAYWYALSFYCWGLWHGQTVDFWDCYYRRLEFLRIFDN